MNVIPFCTEKPISELLVLLSERFEHGFKGQISRLWRGTKGQSGFRRYADTSCSRAIVLPQRCQFTREAAHMGL